MENEYGGHMDPNEYDFKHACRTLSRRLRFFWPRMTHMERYRVAKRFERIITVIVLGNDVYAAGRGDDTATVWKNGQVLHRFKNGGFPSSACSVFVQRRWPSPGQSATIEAEAGR